MDEPVSVDHYPMVAPPVGLRPAAVSWLCSSFFTSLCVTPFGTPSRSSPSDKKELKENCRQLFEVSSVVKMWMCSRPALLV